MRKAILEHALSDGIAVIKQTASAVAMGSHRLELPEVAGRLPHTFMLEDEVACDWILVGINTPRKGAICKTGL